MPANENPLQLVEELGGLCGDNIPIDGDLGFELPYGSVLNVENVFNQTPLTITDHSSALGALVRVSSVQGFTAANGACIITKIDNNNFTLDFSEGNGAWTSGALFRSCFAAERSPRTSAW